MPLAHGDGEDSASTHKQIQCIHSVHTFSAYTMFSADQNVLMFSADQNG